MKLTPMKLLRKNVLHLSDQTWYKNDNSNNNTNNTNSFNTTTNHRNIFTLFSRNNAHNTLTGQYKNLTLAQYTGKQMYKSNPNLYHFCLNTPKLMFEKVAVVSFLSISQHSSCGFAEIVGKKSIKNILCYLT